MTIAMVTAGMLLAAGTTTVIVQEMHARETYAWQVPYVSETNFWQALSNNPAQVKIVPTKYPRGINRGAYTFPRQGIGYDEMCSLGTAVTPEFLIFIAYRISPVWTAYHTALPQQKYDYIVNVPHGSFEAFQNELRAELGLVARYDYVETNVLLMKLVKPSTNGFTESFRPPNSLNPNWGMPIWWSGETNILLKSNGGQWVETTHWFNRPLDTFRVNALENIYQLPILNRTGLTNSYDFSFTYPQTRLKDALLNQLGIELVPKSGTNKMLVIEQAKN